MSDSLKALREIPGCGMVLTAFAHDFAAEWVGTCDACLALVRDAVLEEAAKAIGSSAPGDREKMSAEQQAYIEGCHDSWAVVRALKGGVS